MLSSWGSQLINLPLSKLVGSLDQQDHSSSALHGSRHQFDSVKTHIRTKLIFRLIRIENKQLTYYLDNKQKDDSFKFRQENVCK